MLLNLQVHLMCHFFKRLYVHCLTLIQGMKLQKRICLVPVPISLFKTLCELCFKHSLAAKIK